MNLVLRGLVEKDRLTKIRVVIMVASSAQASIKCDRRSMDAMKDHFDHLAHAGLKREALIRVQIPVTLPLRSFLGCIV